MLENFERMPKSVRLGIVSAVLKAEPTRHTEIIKEELNYIVSQAQLIRDGVDINGKPAPTISVADRPAPIRAGKEMMPREFPAPLPGEQHPEAPKPWFLI